MRVAITHASTGPHHWQHNGFRQVTDGAAFMYRTLWSKNTGVHSPRGLSPIHTNTHVNGFWYSITITNIGWIKTLSSQLYLYHVYNYVQKMHERKVVLCFREVSTRTKSCWLSIHYILTRTGSQKYIWTVCILDWAPPDFWLPITVCFIMARSIAIWFHIVLLLK